MAREALPQERHRAALHLRRPDAAWRRGDQPGSFRLHRAHQPRPREDRERGLLLVEGARGRYACAPPAAAPLRIRGRARAVQSVQRPAAARRHSRRQRRRVRRGASGEVDHVPHHGLRGQAARRRDGTPHRERTARLGAERGTRTPLLPRVQGRQAGRLHRCDLARFGRVALPRDRIGRNELRPSRIFREERGQMG